jgi:hypothetical protein
VSVITQFDGLMFTYRDGPAGMKFLFDRSRRKAAAGARPWVESWDMRARRGQATRPQDKPVDGPYGVRGLTTAPRPMPSA